MDSGTPNQNQYWSVGHVRAGWFVLGEDQGNVVFSSNSVSSAPNPQPPVASESRYIVESSTGRLYSDGDGECQEQDTSGSRCEVTDTNKQKEDFWDRNKIKMLLTLCLENKGVVEKEALWVDIGSMIGASAVECHTKYRHLRRTYLRLLRKKRMGKDIKWVHYSMCEEVFTSLGALPAAALELWDDARIRAMLTLYIEYIPRFNNPDCLQKDLWKEIAQRLGLSSYNCYHKFKNLKRSYLNWLSRSRQTGKGMKWPYQPYFERIFCSYNPNAKARPWDRNKIKQLLEAYAEIAYKFRNPKFQKKDLWKDIARKIGETPSMCDKKFRNLKQTYLRLKSKDISRLTSTWRYYKDFESIYPNTTRFIDLDGSKIVYRSDLDDDYIKILLTFYIENKAKFRDPLTKNKTLWRLIAPRLGLTVEECDKKFRNLKQTYIRLACNRKQGKSSKWPYFVYFKQIYSDTRLDSEERSRVDLTQLNRAAEMRKEADTLRVRREQFTLLAAAAEEANRLQRERNDILRALLQRRP